MVDKKVLKGLEKIVGKAHVSTPSEDFRGGARCYGTEDGKETFRLAIGER